MLQQPVLLLSRFCPLTALGAEVTPALEPPLSYSVLACLDAISWENLPTSTPDHRIWSLCLLCVCVGELLTMWYGFKTIVLSSAESTESQVSWKIMECTRFLEALVWRRPSRDGEVVHVTNHYRPRRLRFLLWIHGYWVILLRGWTDLLVFDEQIGKMDDGWGEGVLWYLQHKIRRPWAAAEGEVVNGRRVKHGSMEAAPLKTSLCLWASVLAFISWVVCWPNMTSQTFQVLLACFHLQDEERERPVTTFCIS